MAQKGRKMSVSYYVGLSKASGVKLGHSLTTSENFVPMYVWIYAENRVKE